MKRILFLLASLSFGIILFIFVVRFIGWNNFILAFQSFTGVNGLAILGLTFLMMLVAILKWQQIIESQGCQISITALIRPFLVAHSVNYLMPTVPFGSEIVRGYISSAFVDRILEITAHVIMAFFGIIYFLLKIGMPPRNLAIILGGGFLLALIPMSLFYFKSFKKESLVKFFIKKSGRSIILNVEEEIFNFFNVKKIFFWRGLIMAFLRDIISLLRTFFVIVFLGKSLGFFSTFSIFSFSTLAQFFPIPAALGSLEIVQIFVFGKLGLGAGTATAFTMIVRGAELFFAFLGLFVFFSFGVELLKKLLLNNNRNV
jgi:uncharacterized membrane protein YbhN (UPF0104 family)